MTDPIVTYRADGTPYAVYCGERPSHGCWVVSVFGGLEKATAIAARCCAPRPCDHCGALLKPGSSCNDCRAQRARLQLHADFDGATKVSLAEYKGEQLTDGSDFFITTDDVSADDALVTDGGTRFLWGTTASKPTVDLWEECKEHWLQDHHDDAIDWVDATSIAQAQKLVDKALAGVTTYYADQSVAVLIPEIETSP